VNTLYFGDNLDILRNKIPSDYVDLIYLDPPFQSGKSYNIIFQPQINKIRGTTAQIKTFKDTWQWGEEAEEEYHGLITGTITTEKPTQKLVEFVKAMRGYLGECPMLAYLSMMAPRLVEMRRVMKKTGSIYLHCDPTASHYLKLLMDAVFGVRNFQNEIVWCYRGGGAPKAGFGKRHDVIFRYSKTSEFFFYPDAVRVPYEAEGIGRTDDAMWGKHKGVSTIYKPHPLGKVPEDWWPMNILNANDPERLGYPTQKPETLLKRIILASSNDGHLVLDPFCGCGTTIAVAQGYGRNWIGIDVTYLAIDIIKKRLEKSGIREGIHFEIDGDPTDLYSAEKLARQKPFQFQVWCVSKLDATPSETKTADQGIDGIINFIDATKTTKAGIGIIQVKGTQSVNPDMVRSLKGTIKSQNADFGILITLKKPTQGMITEAVKEGYSESAKKVPKIQLLTVEDLFSKAIPVILPSQILPPYKKPEVKKEQRTLF